MMIDSIPVTPRSSDVQPYEQFDRKLLLKRARKLKAWTMSKEEALKIFTRTEVSFLRAYYLVRDEDVRRMARRRGWKVELPRLLRG